MKNRCPWPLNDPLMIEYHDLEWGVPLHDDKKLFEFLILESFQAGLSWRTVLHKRENFRRAFAGFDVEKVARFGKKEISRLLKNKGIIRNRLKIEGAINNAKCFLLIREEYGSFDNYVWSFVGHRPVINRRKKLSDLPARTQLSDAMSEDMGRRGFKFRGSTICYAFMQAVGMVNDHMVSCFRYREITNS
ncbi:MAG: DNA-3-methyladenine glycosylase I [Bacteroidetes bacterium]|nr:DNA-3-methyladenine glycosylase I [Bacteroidota bacterium]